MALKFKILDLLTGKTKLYDLFNTANIFNAENRFKNYVYRTLGRTSVTNTYCIQVDAATTKYAVVPEVIHPSSFTIQCLAYVSDWSAYTSDTKVIFSNRYGADNAFVILRQYNSIYCRMGDSAGIKIEVGYDMSTYVGWAHITATFDETTGELKLYIDGDLKATATGAVGGVNYTLNNYLFFGAQPPNSEYTETPYSGTDFHFTGLIDECAIFNRPLKDFEIQPFYNGDEEGLLGLWRFEEGVGSVSANEVSGGTQCNIYCDWSTSVLTDTATEVDKPMPYTDSFTEGNLPEFDTEGNLVDSASKVSDFEQLSNKNQPNGYAGLDADGKVDSTQLPALALTDTYTVASEAEQIALTAQEGDICIRTDLNKTFVHNGGSAGDITDWSELLTPTDSVTSVDGLTGAVDLTGKYAAIDHTHASIGNAVSIQGVAVSTTAPTTGQVLAYNGTQYEPTTPSSSDSSGVIGYVYAVSTTEVGLTSTYVNLAPFSSKTIDTLSEFDLTTGTFTASRSGVINLRATVQLRNYAEGIVTQVILRFIKNNSTTTIYQISKELYVDTSQSSLDDNIHLDCTVELSTGDTIDLEIASGGNSNTVYTKADVGYEAMVNYMWVS